MKTFEEIKNEVAYKRFKTDYRYIGSDLCKVLVLEEALELCAKELATEKVKLAIDLARYGMLVDYNKLEAYAKKDILKQL